MLACAPCSLLSCLLCNFQLIPTDVSQKNKQALDFLFTSLNTFLNTFGFVSARKRVPAKYNVSLQFNYFGFPLDVGRSYFQIQGICQIAAS